MVEGEIISVKFEKAYKEQQKAFDFVNAQAKKSFTQMIDVPGQGPVEFLCEYSVQQLEVEE